MIKLNKIKSIITDNVMINNNNKFFDKSVEFIDSHCDINNNKKSILVFLKEFFKKYSNFYSFLIFLISSSYLNPIATNKRNKLIKINDIILNIGSWNKIINKKVINLDITNYLNVDIVWDATKLSIKNNSVDLIINETNLEHIYDFKSVLKETYRVLKQDWKIYFTIPFMFNFHSSPYDFFRFTHISIEELLKELKFSDIKIWIYSGPASSLVNILTDFFSVLFSFWNDKLYNILNIVFLLLLWPIKFLDIILVNFDVSKNSTSVFYVTAKK